MAENNMQNKAEQPVLDNTMAQNAPTPPNLTAEEADTLAHEGAAASAPPKPAPSREPIPIFKENPISTVSGPEKPAPAQRGRPKTEKTPEAAPADKAPPPKRGRKPTADKQNKPAASATKEASASKEARLPLTKRRLFPERPLGPLKRNRLFSFRCWSFIRSKIIPLASVTMQKCRLLRRAQGKKRKPPRACTPPARRWLLNYRRASAA